MAEKVATLKEVMEYFGMASAEFTKEWKQMDAKSRDELKRGIGDGTLTY